MTDEQIDQLIPKICDIYDTTLFRSGYVGMLFAGYGTNEIFPRMYHIHLSGIINGKVRYIKIEEASISELNIANITPVAQTDVMQTFLFGINDGFIEQISNEVPIQITKQLASIDNSCFAEGQRSIVIKKLNESTKIYWIKS